MSRANDRFGFTLIELTAGLALAALVFLGMRTLLVQLADAGDRIDREAAAANARANGERLLAALVGRVSVIGDSASAFDFPGHVRFTGDASHASFESWCETPSGWLERCRVRLTLATRGDSTIVDARLSTGDSIALVAVSGAAHFIYADLTARDDIWVTSWGSSIAIPAAVGIVVEAGRDTMVLPAAGRP
jgi:hypothetical protein